MIPVIHTQQLEIKAFYPADSDALAQLLTNGEIKKTYMLPDFPDSQACGKLVRRLMELSQNEDHFVRGIYLEEQLIGFVNDVEIQDGTLELGYVIHPDRWGKGYATQMLRGVLAALLGNPFAQIKTGAFEENTASIRVMEKCAMERLPDRDTVEYRGKTHTCVYYSCKKE